MKSGYLSQYFKGIAFKKLSAVEADTSKSNQHEFNGVKSLKELLGEPEGGKQQHSATFMFLTDSHEDNIFEQGLLTWYDARQNARTVSNVMRWEYRLYFPTNLVFQKAKPGDILILAKRPDETLLTIIVEDGTTISQQLIWLFGISELSRPGFFLRSRLDSEKDRIRFASRIILEQIGIQVDTSQDDYLDEMIRMFSGKFPKTKDFSAFARKTLAEINPLDGHDEALMAWMEREEALFRTLEKHIIGERLAQGFDNDVDGFISFSLSVQNRRKSRVGLALENHLEILFQECGIRHRRSAVTENRSKPDFIFPGQSEYNDPSFPEVRLTMLGVKSTCKDRWRQVLAEADRIRTKHLLTLEASISNNQTNEMKANGLQLVLPKSLHDTYLPDQKLWIISVSDFIKHVVAKQ